MRSFRTFRTGSPISISPITHTEWDLNIPVSESLHGAPRAILSGWELGSIFSAHTGVPFTAKVNSDIAFTGNSRVNSSAGGQRPNFNPIPGCSTNPVNSGQPTNYINLSCFSLPALGTLGDLGRNTLRGPGSWTSISPCSETSGSTRKGISSNFGRSLQRAKSRQLWSSNYWRL